MGLTEFQGQVVDQLNAQDTKNEDLLDQVCTAANAVSDTDSDITLTADDKAGLTDTATVNAHGGIKSGGKVASLQGTGGVALLEYAKDAIQTAVANISGMGTNSIMAKKKVEQKLGPIGA